MRHRLNDRAAIVAAALLTVVALALPIIRRWACAYILCVAAIAAYGWTTPDPAPEPPPATTTTGTTIGP